MAKKTKKDKKTKMKEMSSKEKLWSSRINTMRVYMDNANARKGWKKLKDFYKGDYEKALGLKIPVITVNLVYAFVRTAVSNLFARNPKFKCNATKNGDILAAKIAEQALNYHWYAKKIKRQVKKSIKEGKLVGYSWIKVGYSAEIGFQGDQESEYVKKDDIFAIHVPYDSIWYDPEALDPPYDCKWMIHHYLRPTQELRDKYNDSKIQASDEIDYTSRGKKKNNMLLPQDSQMTRVYEIWDDENKEINIYVSGSGILEEKPWKYKMNGFPFSMLTFDTMIDVDEPDNLPTPEINKFLDQILEKMKIRSMMMNHIKRFGRQMISAKDALSEEARSQYQQGHDGAIIEAETQGQPLDNVLKPISYAAMQPEVYGVENRIDLDLDRVSGQNPSQQGGTTTTKSKTLGELEQIQQGSDSYTIEQQDIVEEFTEEVARKIIALMKQYFDGERYARILGQVGQEELQFFQQAGVLQAGSSLRFTKDQIQGEYDLEVVAGSTLPLDHNNRLRNLFNLAKFGQAFGLTPSSVTSYYLGKEIMEEMEMYDVAKAYQGDINRLLAPKQPDPKEQLEMLSKKQAVDNRAADTQLKRTRIEANNLSNVGKALKNAQGMEDNGVRDRGQWDKVGKVERTNNEMRQLRK